MRWVAKLKQFFQDLFVDCITCPKCKASVERSAYWGRFIEYRCGCGRTTKLKCYD